MRPLVAIYGNKRAAAAGSARPRKTAKVYAKVEQPRTEREGSAGSRQPQQVAKAAKSRACPQASARRARRNGPDCLVPDSPDLARLVGSVHESDAAHMVRHTGQIRQRCPRCCFLSFAACAEQELHDQRDNVKRRMRAGMVVVEYVCVCRVCMYRYRYRFMYIYIYIERDI